MRATEYVYCLMLAFTASFSNKEIYEMLLIPNSAGLPVAPRFEAIKSYVEEG
jgi:hypothetical protein